MCWIGTRRQLIGDESRRRGTNMPWEGREAWPPRDGCESMQRPASANSRKRELDGIAARVPTLSAGKLLEIGSKSHARVSTTETAIAESQAGIRRIQMLFFERAGCAAAHLRCAAARRAAWPLSSSAGCTLGCNPTRKAATNRTRQVSPFQISRSCSARRRATTEIAVEISRR